MPGSLSPLRPPSEVDLMRIVNGAPMFPAFPGLQLGQPLPGSQLTMQYATVGQAPGTGILTSTGTAVNNVTTATPFATGALDANNNRGLAGSMAGRVYLVTAVAAGSLMASDSPKVGTPDYWTVALNTTVPPLAATFPGIPLNAGDVRLLIMGQTTGWLQWISSAGTASLVCTELF
jgi:hypothetical protein